MDNKKIQKRSKKLNPPHHCVQNWNLIQKYLTIKLKHEMNTFKITFH